MRKWPFIALQFTLFLTMIIACMSGWMISVLPTSTASHVEQPAVPRVSLKLLWGASVVPSNDWIDTALVNDGTLYYSTAKFATGQQHVGAFDLQSRQPRWAIPATANLPVMVEQGNMLLVDQTARTLTALREMDGAQVWSISLPQTLHSIEATTGSGLIFVGSLNEILAVDAVTGNIVWRYSLPQGFVVDPFKASGIKERREYSALTFHEGTLYVRAVKTIDLSGGSPLPCLLLALDTQKGETLWTFSFVIEMPRGDEPAIATQPTFSDTRLFILTWKGSAYLLDRATGKVIWEKPGFGLSSQGINPRIWDNHTMVLQQSTKLIGLAIPNGEVLWSGEISVPVSPLRISEEVVFLVHYSTEPTGKDVIVVDLRTGAIIGKQPLSSLEPPDEQSVSVLADDANILYLVLARNVYAFSASAR